MAIAGKKSLIKMSTDPTGFANEASATSDDKVYQVSSTSIKGLPFAPSATITVAGSSAGGSTQTGYTINRLNGSVIFDSSASRTVFLSGDYLPLITIAEAHEYSYTLTATNEADNAFGDVFVTREQMLKDVTGSLTEWYTTGLGTRFFDVLTSSSQLPLVIETFGTSTGTFDARFWGLIDSNELPAEVSALIDDTVSFEGTWDANNRVVTFTTAGSG